MMPQAESYPFVASDPKRGAAALLPFLPLTLTLRQRSIAAIGLLDTAATVNVLPFDIGEQLGAVWDEQPTSIQLTGNLGREEAKGIVLAATIGRFAPVRLVFAWSKSDAVPLLLGQMNFLLEFDVWLSRSQAIFEVKPRSH